MISSTDFPRRACFGAAGNTGVLPQSTRSPLLVLLAVAATLFTLPTRAHLPGPRLQSVWPPGAQSGATLDITVAGSDLDDLASLTFTDPRIRAELLANSPNTFRVLIPSNLPPALVEARVTGRFGVSNPKPFSIHPAPTLTPPSTNTSPASAIPLNLNQIINGRTTANTIDHYRVHLTKNQRVTVRIEASELDSKLSPVLAISDSNGQELSRARRSWISFQAPHDGPFLITLHDLLFKGSDEYPYRLTVTTAPHIDRISPAVVRRGVPQPITLFGRQLPGGVPSGILGLDGQPLEKLDLQIAVPAHPLAEIFPRRTALSADGWTWRWNTTNGFSNPVFLPTTSLPVVQAPSPLPQSPELVPVTPPVDFSGRFAPRGQLAGVSFKAKKGDVWWIEITADRLGFPSDPSAIVQKISSSDNPKAPEKFEEILELSELDANPIGNDFALASRDCAGRFQAPSDGLYRIVVRDLFNLGATHPRYDFRLTLRPESPDFRLVALPLPLPRINNDDRQIHPRATALRQGETLPIRVVALRQDRFNDEIELSIRGLGSGLVAPPSRIPAGQSVGLLLVTAPTNATPWSGPVEIVGRATVGAQPISHTAQPGSFTWHIPDFNNEPVAARLAQQLWIASLASDPAPVAVALNTNSVIEATAGAKISLPIAIRRAPGFDAAFNLRPAGHPALDKAKEVAIPAKAESGSIEINLAELKLPAGVHPLWIQGQATGKYRNAVSAADTASQAAKEAETAANAAAAELKKLQEIAAKAPAAEKAAAESAVKAATEKSKAADDRKNAAAQKAKAASDRANARDTTVSIFSPTFTLRIVEPEKTSSAKK